MDIKYSLRDHELTRSLQQLADHTYRRRALLRKSCSAPTRTDDHDVSQYDGAL